MADKKKGKKKQKGSANPAYPNAHPTAPGGMSQPALREELTTKHGFLDYEVDEMSWPDMITAVADGRRQRELEAEAKAKAEAEEAAIPNLLWPEPGTRNYMFDGHWGAGPSASSRWLHCTGSLDLSRKFLETLTPRQQQGFAYANLAARQGTTAHKAAEAKAMVMLGQMTDAELEATLRELSVEPETGDEAYTEEMGEYVDEYVDLLKTFHDEGREVHIEQRVSAVIPLTGSHDGEVYEVKGSADATALPLSLEPRKKRTKKNRRTIDVVDLKYGNGIYVEADENSQARLYGLGVLNQLVDDEGNLPDVDDMTYHIAQPRFGGIRSWTESIDDLLEWRDTVVAPALTAALYGPEEGAVFAPSESACQFCPARGTCEALAEDVFAKGADLFDAIDDAMHANVELRPDLMPSDRLGDFLAQARDLTKLAASLKEEAQRRLYRGESVPGFQLVSHTPKRTWKEEATEVLDPGHDALPSDVLRQVWKHSLVTPTQALKIAGKEHEATLTPIINVPDKYPVVAPDGDRRAPWTGRAPEDMFDDLPEGV